MSHRNGYYLAARSRHGGPHKARDRDRPPDWKVLLDEEREVKEEPMSAQEDTDPGHCPFRESVSLIHQHVATFQHESVSF